MSKWADPKEGAATQKADVPCVSIAPKKYEENVTGQVLVRIVCNITVNISLVVGEFARTGWLVYPPLSELPYSPSVGVDYYLWALLISGVGTLMTGINFVTTILKIRAPGMSYLRMTIFCWTALASHDR